MGEIALGAGGVAASLQLGGVGPDAKRGNSKLSLGVCFLNGIVEQGDQLGHIAAAEVVL